MNNRIIKHSWFRAARLPNIYILTAILAMLMLMLTTFTGCSQDSGSLYAPTAVPSDFAVEIDQNNYTYFQRQHVRQVITASDMMSRTTYTNLSDYNNSTASQYTVITPLNENQIQAMWNAVYENDLLQGAGEWTYWQTPVDLYQERVQVLQVRANGMQQVYVQINHWDNDKLPLVFLCQAVGVPIGQNVNPQYPATTAPATNK